MPRKNKRPKVYKRTRKGSRRTRELDRIAKKPELGHAYFETVAGAVVSRASAPSPDSEHDWIDCGRSRPEPV
jgi:hypothetical protein